MSYYVCDVSTDLAVAVGVGPYQCQINVLKFD